MDTTVTGRETDMQPDIRVSDAERQHVVDVLQRHTSEGRLTLDEFSTRVDAAQRAVTRADLAAVTADLPEPPAPTPATRRPLVIGLLVAAIVVVLLLVVGVVAAVSGWGHMGPMKGGCCR
jgi:hypothetical protein